MKQLSRRFSSSFFGKSKFRELYVVTCQIFQTVTPKRNCLLWKLRNLLIADGCFGIIQNKFGFSLSERPCRYTATMLRYCENVKRKN